MNIFVKRNFTSQSKIKFILNAPIGFQGSLLLSKYKWCAFSITTWSKSLAGKLYKSRTSLSK